MKTYFVVFAFQLENSIAISNMTLNYNKKITNYKDIEYIEKSIENVKNISEVKLINYKLLRGGIILCLKQ